MPVKYYYTFPGQPRTNVRTSRRVLSCGRFFPGRFLPGRAPLLNVFISGGNGKY